MFDLIKKYLLNYKVIINVIILGTLLIYCIFVEKSQPIKITKFGPLKTTEGQGFNIQPFGGSSIWINTENITNESIVAVWGTTQLKTVVFVNKQLVTAAVPNELFKKTGTFKIYIIDTENNIKSNEVLFNVEKKKSHNKSNNLQIIKFGPTYTKAKQKFNIQPNGESAIWIRTEGINSKSIVAVWKDTKLVSTVYIDKQLVTAAVPDKLFAFPGVYKIYLYDPIQDTKSTNKGMFIVD